MARSDWDILAFGSDGKPCDGEMEGFCDGAGVEIYKVSLHVRDRKGWHEGLGFCEPIIGVVDSGSVCMAGMNILAKRVSGGIFVLVWDVKQAGREKSELRVMGGVGCYGWDDNVDRVCEACGVKREDWDEVWIGSGYGNMKDFEGKPIKVISAMLIKDDEIVETREVPEEGNEHLEVQWVGVTKEMYEGLMEWLGEQIEKEGGKLLKEWFEKVKEEVPIRFNQGDKVIAQGMGMEVGGSDIGKGEEPLFVRVMKGFGGVRT